MSKIKKLSKLRQGQEIDLEWLNTFVSTVNAIVDEYEVIEKNENESSEIIKKLNEVLVNFNSEYKEKMDSIPYLKDLLIKFASLNNTISFTDEIKLDGSPLLTNGDVRFIVTNNILPYENKTSPNLKEKTLILHLGDDKTKGNELYFYYSGKLYNLSRDANNVQASINVPTIDIENDLWVINGATTTYPSRGAQGEQGPQGPQGEKGNKGDRGLTGLQGPQGIKGKDGRTVMIKYCSADTINGQGVIEDKFVSGKKFIGFKFYYEGDSDNTIKAIPWQFIRISGDTYYPHLKNGESLYFSTQPPSETDWANGYKVKGDRGDQGIQGPKGDVGPAPTLDSKKSDVNYGEVKQPTLDIKTKEDEGYKDLKGDYALLFTLPNIEPTIINGDWYINGKKIGRAQGDPGFNLKASEKECTSIGDSYLLKEENGQSTLLMLKNIDASGKKVFEPIDLAEGPAGPRGTFVFTNKETTDAINGDLCIDPDDYYIYKYRNDEWINTYINIKGVQGKQGPDGKAFEYEDFTPEQLEQLKVIPYIGENNNWFVNGNDLKVKAKGENGQDGNKILYLDQPKSHFTEMTSEDTNISADGKEENKPFKPNDLIITSDYGLLMAELGESGYKWRQVRDLTPEKGPKGDTPVFEVRSGSEINEVGTPKVLLSTDESGDKPKIILTFNYLKGEQGYRGDRGEKGDSCNFQKNNILKGVPKYSYNEIASQGTTRITIDFSLDISTISRGLTIEFSFTSSVFALTGNELIYSSGYITADSLKEVVDATINNPSGSYNKIYCPLYVASIFGSNYSNGSTNLYYTPEDNMFHIYAYADMSEQYASKIKLEKVILNEIVAIINK